jgi:hypothetical protein
MGTTPGTLERYAIKGRELVATGFEIGHLLGKTMCIFTHWSDYDAKVLTRSEMC